MRLPCPGWAERQRAEPPCRARAEPKRRVQCGLAARHRGNPLDGSWNGLIASAHFPLQDWAFWGARMRFGVRVIFCLFATILIGSGCRKALTPNIDRNQAPETWITAA